MNDENPTPNPNLNDRLKKIAAAQKEAENMTPSPEQIAYEQMLEVFAESQRTNATVPAAVIAATTALTTTVQQELRDHRTRETTTREASETRIITAVVAKLSPKFSNEDVIDRINLWSSIITAVLVAGVCILIVLIGRR